jgi:hypothetical protein
MKRIFENAWMRIEEDGGQHCLKYNSGDLTNSQKEIFISEEDALIAQQSNLAAENIIHKYFNLETRGESK